MVWSKMVHIWIALLALLFGLLDSLPTPKYKFYEPSIVYSYKYSTNVLLNENASPGAGRNVGYGISSLVKVSTIWTNPKDSSDLLFHVKIEKPQLWASSIKSVEEGFVQHKSSLDTLSVSHGIFAHFKAGVLTNIFTSGDHDPLLNLHKGVVSIFDFNHPNPEYSQEDVSGHCQISLKVSGRTLQKVKSECALEDAPSSPPNPLQSSNVTISSEIKYQLEKYQQIISKASGKDIVSMNVHIWPSSSVAAISNFDIQYKEQTNDGIVLQGGSIDKVIYQLKQKYGVAFKKDSPLAEKSKLKDRPKYVNSVPEMVRDLRSNMSSEYLASLKSCSTYLKLLRRFRGATKEDLVKILQTRSNYEFMPQLLDVIAATQTPESLQAAFEILDLKKSDLEIVERFFITLALATNPSETFINKIFEISKNDFFDAKLRNTILISLGSLTKTYSRLPKHNTQLVKDITEFLLNELNKCSEDECRLMFLSSLRNAALPSTIPTILHHIKKGGSVSLIALLALKSMEPTHISSKEHEILLKAFHQFWQPQDTTNRILAAEILLSTNPHKDHLHNLILSLANQEQCEVSTLVFSKLQDLLVHDHLLRNSTSELFNNSSLGNYLIFSQNGSSTAFTKYLAGGKETNLKYGINLEQSSGGMLKRTSFDIILDNNSTKLPLLSIGLFASGVGGDDEDDGQEVGAGLELTVLGVHLRPYQLFRGKTELMGHIWSGTGSEPTPMFQGNLLFMDHLENIPLQNGLIVTLDLKSVLSINHQGSIQISMWNRNCHSLVNISAALMMQGSATVNSPFASSFVEFSTGGETQVYFETDLDFQQKPALLCLQMSQPPFNFRQNTRKMETIPGSQHLIKTLKKKTMFLQGKSFAFHQNNNEQCADLLVE